MKKTISNLLANGFTKSKKTMDDFAKYLFILKYILKVNELGWITCNDNAFWKAENNQNRIDLMHDVLAIHKKDIRDTSYFHIMNRFANGDKYGIEVTE